MKKHLIVGVICLLLAACGKSQSFFPPSGLKSTADPGAEVNFTYHFDENSGAVAVNSDGNGYFNGNLYGPTWVTGKVGSALQFGSALGSRVEIPMSDLATGAWYHIPFDNSISIGAWIKLDSMPTSESYHIVGSGYYGVSSFRLRINVGGQIEFLLNDGLTWQTIVTSNQILTPGTWYYVAVTYDETIGRIYINGVEDKNYALSLNIPSNYNTIFIGAIDNDVNASQSYQNQFAGIIDELRISKNLWAAQQISDYYNSTK